MAIFVITAPSGAGKTTIAQSLERKGVWKECISHTTRPMRTGEVDGKTYYFISNEQFDEMVKNKEFAEKVPYDNNSYGITHEEIKRVTESGRDIFVIAEYGGYKQIKELYPDAVGIFLYMSKEDCMANMLLRGDSISKAFNRISTYDDEIKNRNKFDYVIKNVRGKQEATEKIIEYIVMQYK